MLDFNHFYAMEEEHHVQLITYLIAEFGHKICHNCDIADLTLCNLWKKGHQVGYYCSLFIFNLMCLLMH